MTNEEAVRKLEYSKTAYQMLIDEKVDSGKLVGKDVKGEWKADTPLDEAYKSMIDALEMGIKAIKALEQETCDNAVSRQDVLDLAKKGILVSNGNYESVCKVINELPSVNPQPCENAIDRAEAIKIASGYCHPANVAKELAKLPSVNPTKTGYWVGEDGKPSHLKDGMTTKSVWCSECGKWLTASDEYSCFGKFCPSCGTKMESEE